MLVLTTLLRCRKSVQDVPPWWLGKRQLVVEKLIVKGAREHNLQNIDIEIPRNSIVVFTGLSGSGKSSLAFDTIFAEGQRRYVESLSAYARQFLGQMDKPDVDFIEGLSPAVSIDQKSTNRNPRSTVGTITEIYDYLRLLFARVGTPHCPVCHSLIEKQSPTQIVDQLFLSPEGTRLHILAPIVRSKKGEFVDLFSSLSAQGYSRVQVDGVIYQLHEVPALKKQERHDIEVLVDRVVVKKSARSRITGSIETAVTLSEGIVAVEFVDMPTDSPDRVRKFSEHYSCPNNHIFPIVELEPRSFSFNSPYGACPACDGLGVEKEVDVDLVIPDKSKSLSQKAIAPWSFGNSVDYFQKLLSALADALEFSMNTPFHQLDQNIQEAILHGCDTELKVRYKNRYGRPRSFSSQFEGVIPWLHRKLRDGESESSKERIEAYMRDIPCSHCHGARLRKEVLAVTITNTQGEEKSIAQVTELPIQECLDFIEYLQLTPQQEAIASVIVREITARLKFLIDVGLDYLSLDRAAGTLSGGEAQRIRLATQIGSGLAGVLYVLDEPSIGLHQRDNRRLIATLEKLRDIGNTVLVVEHDEDTIKAADWIVDIGPGAGEYGGKVVHSGSYRQLLKNTASSTGNYLAGRSVIPIPAQRRKKDATKTLWVRGARENNLQNIDVEFPLGMFVAVSGISGSGKSTLVNDILATALANELNGARIPVGKCTRIEGIEHLDKIVRVDQSPIGRTPRSNPATYTGVFDKIRTLFAGTADAKVRGYQPGRFSFNIKGGRCEACQGEGTLKIEMNFLPDVYVPCEVCHGARYNKETLEIQYKGKNISEVLNMSISQAAEFFEPIGPIHRYLATLVDVGLGYVRLGQSAPTLSGGEAQRVKLATELQKRSTGKTIYILDEPTTGLHFEDISKLLKVLQELVDKGNTVIVIEHNLDVIKSVDWVIDMGPSGGKGGGKVVAQGTPEQVAHMENSPTGEFLAQLLSTTA